MIHFTGDTHFNHARLMELYPARGVYTCVDDMTENLIAIWNRDIGPKDTVYHVGDFSMGDDAAGISVLRRLNGHKYLVPGNHDKRILRNPEFVAGWKEVLPALSEIKINKERIVLCHFPIWEWNKAHRGAWHIHGHVHGKPTGIPGKILDVGIDGNALRPYNWDTVKEFMDSRPLRTHH